MVGAEHSMVTLSLHFYQRCFSVSAIIAHLEVSCVLLILVVQMCHSQVGLFGCFLPLATLLVSSSSRKANPLEGYFHISSSSVSEEHSVPAIGT